MPSTPPRDPGIDAILRELPAPQRRVAQALRRSIRSVAPRLEECVKWNAPNWRGTGLVFCLMVYSDHVNLGLWRGKELAASFNAIEGTGKSLRHVKVRSVAQAQSPELRRLMRSAVALDARQNAPAARPATGRAR